jgi:pimeloyl-ACP methyl ester carboxylesterase
MANRIVTLPSGRTVGLSTAGDPAAQRVVLFCHPTPGAGQFDPDPTITDRWGVHLMALDRPGYGATPADAGDVTPTIEHRADDLAEFLTSSEESAGQVGDSERGPVGLVGWGTGGMVALSLAARHPGLVNRVAVVNTVAPHRVAFDPVTVTAAPYGLDSLSVRRDDPVFGKLGLDGRVERMLAEAGLQGDAGVSADRRMLADPGWAGELGRIQAEVRLIYGDADSTADIVDGRWYRRRIRRSRVVRVPGEGALTIASRWARILGHVAPQHGGLSAMARFGAGYRGVRGSQRPPS